MEGTNWTKQIAAGVLARRSEHKGGPPCGGVQLVVLLVQLQAPHVAHHSKNKQNHNKIKQMNTQSLQTELDIPWGFVIHTMPSLLCTA